MGATSLLRYLQLYSSENIVCGVVDSAYKSLRMLVFDVLPFIPNFVIEAAYSYICRTNAEKIGYDISNLEVFSKMRTIDCPLLFLASRIDGMVPFGHTYDLFRYKQGEKELVEICADHNDRRSLHVTQKCIAFVMQKLESYERNRPMQRLPLYYEPELFRTE
jgi:hypothetical protein